MNNPNRLKIAARLAKSKSTKNDPPPPPPPSSMKPKPNKQRSKPSSRSAPKAPKSVKKPSSVSKKSSKKVKKPPTSKPEASIRNDPSTNGTFKTATSTVSSLPAVQARPLLAPVLPSKQVPASSVSTLRYGTSVPSSASTNSQVVKANTTLELLQATNENVVGEVTHQNFLEHWQKVRSASTSVTGPGPGKGGSNTSKLDHTDCGMLTLEKQHHIAQLMASLKVAEQYQLVMLIMLSVNQGFLAFALIVLFDVEVEYQDVFHDYVDGYTDIMKQSYYYILLILQNVNYVYAIYLLINNDFFKIQIFFAPSSIFLEVLMMCGTPTTPYWTLHCIDCGHAVVDFVLAHYARASYKNKLLQSIFVQ